MKSFVALALAAFVTFAKAGLEDMPTIDVNDFQQKTFSNLVDHFNF
jgi:hypothetical protein